MYKHTILSLMNLGTDSFGELGELIFFKCLHGVTNSWHLSVTTNQLQVL